MAPRNVLFILSDEHRRMTAGCYGDPIIRTPNLDALSRRGTTFQNAYCNSPICVPSRASLATGKYVSQIGYWDNAQPYDGKERGWAHALSEAGHRVASIGKLHYKDEVSPVGFSEQILPMHVVEGKGDLYGVFRNPPLTRPGMRKLSEEIGPGTSSYIQYDRSIADAACQWLEERGQEENEKPWVGFISFVCPHFPLIAPEEFYALYDPDRMPWPKGRDMGIAQSHPVLEAFRKYQNYDDFFRDERHVRIAIASYYGLVSFLDDNVGKVLRALRDAGLEEETLIIYSSDHGDNLGARNYWGKSLMYEDSIGVPLIVAGPDVPHGRTCQTAVSLVDIAPTILQTCGLSDAEAYAGLPGSSLTDVANAPDDNDRVVFSEYHAVSSVTGCFMIRRGDWKLVHFEGYAPLLFDLKDDPDELSNLATMPEYADQLKQMEALLREIVDPAAATARAFEDQQAVIVANGGLESIMRRGEFPHTPIPGEAPAFESK